MRTLQQDNQPSLLRIDHLRKKIDNMDYLYDGIQRIAQILSDELLNIPQRGAWYEQQRQRGE
jgi:hypothetical protein